MIAQIEGHHAGALRPGGAAIDFSVKGWNAVIDTTLNGTWYTMQAAARKWREADIPGSIVNGGDYTRNAGHRAQQCSCCRRNGTGLAQTASLAKRTWGFERANSSGFFGRNSPESIRPPNATPGLGITPFGCPGRVAIGRQFALFRDFSCSMPGQIEQPLKRRSPPRTKRSPTIKRMSFSRWAAAGSLERRRKQNGEKSAICFETATRRNIMIAMTDHRSIQCPMPTIQQ
jgi:hypothetical protein